MDMQKLIDMLGSAGRQSRKGYHLTLGAAIEALEKEPAEAKLVFDSGGGPYGPHSYRGYYSDLAFKTGEDTTVGAFLRDCRASLGETFEGYKGGDFPMDAETPLWASTYGTSSGIAIVGLINTGEKVTLLTKKVD